MRNLLLLLVALIATGCASFRDDDNPYLEPPFYMRWAGSDSEMDRNIREVVSALREDPNSAPLHNQLGQLLVRKGFPKDAEREFERAVNADSRFYPAWYNLGLVRASRDDYSGARRAFHRTVRLMKGHSEALFELGLIEEERGNRDQAVEYYAKALRHNPQIIDVRNNPRVIDSDLIHLALMRNYEREHARLSSGFESTPAGYVPPEVEAPSPQARPQDIVTPAPPATEPATQPAPPTPPSP